MHRDVESTDHEQRVHSELDPLIQCNAKVLTKQEAHLARAQFLALCLSMFVMGWTDGSTGPLLPRIQVFYYVSWSRGYSFFNVSWILPRRQVGFATVSWIFALQCTVSAVYWLMILGAIAISLQDIQGVVVGALLNMPVSDRLGLGNVSF